MPDVYFQTTTNFPQTAANRTRTQAAVEMSDWVGGSDLPEELARAARHWDAAVREFNSVCWRFNRQTQDITLVAGTKTYELNANFRTPQRCVLLDSNGDVRDYLSWLPYEDWILLFPWQGGGNSKPDFYTARNIHENGLVTFEPFPAGTLAYPTAQITYFSRILFASGNDDCLNVPAEVDEAIFQRAVAKLVSQVRGGPEATRLLQEAEAMRFAVEREHREFGEENLWGAS